MVLTDNWRIFHQTRIKSTSHSSDLSVAFTACLMVVSESFVLGTRYRCRAALDRNCKTDCLAICGSSAGIGGLGTKRLVTGKACGTYWHTGSAEATLRSPTKPHERPGRVSNSVPPSPRGGTWSTAGTRAGGNDGSARGGWHVLPALRMGRVRIRVVAVRRSARRERKNCAWTVTGPVLRLD